MKTPKYLTILGIFSIISLILILKVLLIFLEGCLCINRKVDFEKFKDNLFFLNQKSIRRQRGRVVTHRTDDQHGLGSKPTCDILFCSWEKHFTALSPAWWS